MSERESRNIMILGLGTGGLYASKAASITDRDARISIVEQRAYDLFSPRGRARCIAGFQRSLPVRAFMHVLRAVFLSPSIRAC